MTKYVHTQGSRENKHRERTQQWKGLIQKDNIRQGERAHELDGSGRGKKKKSKE